MTAHQQWWLTQPINAKYTAPPSVLVPGQLYLKFNHPLAADWVDSSTAQRAITVVPNGQTLDTVSGLAGFNLAGRFLQSHPGDAVNTTDHGYLKVAGNFAFGSDDWFIEFEANRANEDVGFNYYVIQLEGDPVAVFQILFSPVSGDVDLICSVTTNADVKEIRVTGVKSDFGTPHRYAFSRHGNIFTSFRDGAVAATDNTAFVGRTLLPAIRGFATIGVHWQADNNVTRSFHGTLDEVYINAGPGSGVSTAYTPTTAERTV